jgi:hypothetical protein
MPQKPREIQFETEYDPKFEVRYAENIMGFLGPGGGRLAFYVDIPQIETGSVLEGQPTPPELSVKTIKRVYFIDIRMSVDSFKAISTWMRSTVEAYDKAVQSGTKASEVPTATGYQ